MPTIHRAGLPSEAQTPALPGEFFQRHAAQNPLETQQSDSAFFRLRMSAPSDMFVWQRLQAALEEADAA